MISLAQVYHWQGRIREYFPKLGYWQTLNMALYSLGMVVARHSAPSRVAEKLGVMGKADTVQRRLERFLDNHEVCWWECCRYWARWVLRRYQGERVILLVDETKLGQHLSVMVVGLAYRGCCIPLVWWCYPPKAWPDGQVAVIDELLWWVAQSLPEGTSPLVEADRGIGTSPALVRCVERLGWQYLFRVQATTRLRQHGIERSLKQLVNAPGQQWSAMQVQVFKKAGWLTCNVHIIWEVGYPDYWCLITNADPTQQGWLYAVRYWQEASFRDLKSDGWQWHTSQIWTPDHAARLILVMAIAYAYSLTLGTCAFDEPDLKSLVTKGLQVTYSLFRLGLRLFDQWAYQPDGCPLFQHPSLFFPAPPPFSISVGA